MLNQKVKLLGIPLLKSVMLSRRPLDIYSSIGISHVCILADSARPQYRILARGQTEGGDGILLRLVLASMIIDLAVLLESRPGFETRSQGSGCATHNHPRTRAHAEQIVTLSILTDMLCMATVLGF